VEASLRRVASCKGAADWVVLNQSTFPVDKLFTKGATNRSAAADDCLIRN